MAQLKRGHNYVTAGYITAKPETGKAINYGGFKDLSNAVAVTSCWLIACIAINISTRFPLGQKYIQYDM